MRWPPRASASLSLFALAAVVALLAQPLRRFPHQDLLWNDLYAAGKTAFAADAWRGHPLATVDLTQGFGQSIFADPKGLAHLLDPAALFAIIVPLPLALFARVLLLAMLGALGLAQVATAGRLDRLTLADFALVAAYFAVPQFFFETSFYFYGLFLCLPGLYWRLRVVAVEPSPKSWIAFCLVGAVAIAVSDIHMVGFVPLLVAFALIMGAERERRVTVVAGGALFGLVLLEYWPVVAEMLAHSGSPVTVSAGAKATFTSYSLGFVALAALTSVAPIFAGPVSLYLNPVLLAEFCGLLSSRGRRPASVPFVRRARIIAMASVLLLVGGAVIYISPSVAARLPSLLRYHVAFIPFMIVVLVAAARAEGARDDASHHMGLNRRLVWFVLAGAAVSAPLKLMLDSSLAFVAQAAAGQPALSQQAKLVARLQTPLTHPAALWPVVLTVGAMVAFAWISRRLLLGGGGRSEGRNGSAGRELPVAAVALVALFGSMYLQSSAGASTWAWHYNRPLQRSLMGELPLCIDSLAKRNRDGGAISILPAAISLEGKESGRNDILLALIELPDAMAARSGFQWRYGYSAANRTVYRALTGDSARTVNFWPPAASRLIRPVEAAQRLGANLIVVADTVLSDSGMVTLGTCPVAGREPENPSLTGFVSVYSVTATDKDAFHGARLTEVHRTSARILVTAPASLPVVFDRSLRARDNSGRDVELLEDSSGLARIERFSDGGAGPRPVQVWSTDWRRSYSVLGMLTMLVLGAAWFAGSRNGDRATKGIPGGENS